MRNHFLMLMVLTVAAAGYYARAQAATPSDMAISPSPDDLALPVGKGDKPDLAYVDPYASMPPVTDPIDTWILCQNTCGKMNEAPWSAGEVTVQCPPCDNREPALSEIAAEAQFRSIHVQADTPTDSGSGDGSFVIEQE